MSQLKITALQDVTVTAQICYRGSIELPKGISGESQGTMPTSRTKEATFRLRKGEVRDDILFVESVYPINGFPDLRPPPHPTEVGQVVVDDKGLLQLEQIS